MNLQDLSSRLAATTCFCRLLTVDSCESTQLLAQEDPEPGCAIYWAEHQSAGRGRQGRSWQDAPGQDLALTFRLQGIQLPAPTWLGPNSRELTSPWLTYLEPTWPD